MPEGKQEPSGPIRFTKNTARSLAPKDRPYEKYDSKQPGLLIRVQPSGKKSWYVVYRVNGRRIRKSLGPAGYDGAVELADARASAQEALSASHRNEDAFEEARRARSERLGAFIDHHFEPYAIKNIRSHDDFLKRVRKHFKPLLNKPMSDIAEADLEKWRKRRAAEGVTIDTMRRELTYLQSILNAAVTRFSLLEHNPVAHYRLEQEANSPIRKNDRKVRYLERGVEDVALRAALAARDDRIREDRASANQWRKARGRPLMPTIGADEYGDHITPIVLLALLTGIDRGDLFSLTWEQVDLDNRRLSLVRGKISRKSSRGWILPLSTEAAEVLRQWKRQTGGKSGLVFPSPRSGERLDNISKAWNGIVEDAALQNFRFKDLRHTFASWLVQGGVDLYVVKDLLCHSSIKTTEVYAHLAPDQKSAAVDRVFAAPSDQQSK